MKSRPLLCRAEQVRALLDGTKTQDRRAAKIVKSLPNGDGWDCLKKPGSSECVHLVGGVWSWTPAGDGPTVPYPRMEEFCPYGTVGDRLWCREAFAYTGPEINETPGYVYRATDPDWSEMKGFKWKPSIHMPRSASRITLEITGVRVERLNEISEEDAMAEGVTWPNRKGRAYRPPVDVDGVSSLRFAMERYRELWESINSAGSWSLNPWVWVIEFRRVQK